MRNDVQKPQKGGARSGTSNGFMPSLRTLSGYLRTVSSGASSVASSVRSAGASVASSIVDRDGDSSSDQVEWAGFDKLECEDNNTRQVLLLGYQSGFQVWDVEEADNVRVLACKRDGPVSFLQMQQKPMPSSISQDKFADVRPLLVVAGNASFPGDGYNEDGLSPPCNGNTTGSRSNGNCNIEPSVVRFYSLKSQSYVHVLKFRSAVYTIRCSSRVVAIAQEAQIHCFDAATLEREYTILTYPITSSCLGSGGIGYGPLAVGPRWLAYSGTPITDSNAGRVSPQHLTYSASFSTSPSNGSLVAHYAKESSKQLAAGIVTLGDIGYKKLSRYCSELLPDNSLNSGGPGMRNNGDTDGHAPDADNVGMVIVRDVVGKSVVAQFRAHTSPILALCFDPSGTLLVTASVQGHNINVFRIMPSCHGSSSGSDSGGSYVHLYKLQRGFTNAVIQDISFSEDSHWIMISSSRGTSHLFAISPSGGAVRLQSTDGTYINGNNGLGVRTKPMARWPPSSGPQKLFQQNLCAPGPPVTLSAVSRIKNGNNGWRGTVSGAAAAATGRASSNSGAIATAFHNCKQNNVYTESNSLRTNYHLLVFYPSGSVIQYVLRPSSGTAMSVLPTPFESYPDNDAELAVEPLQKWDICQKRNRKEREDNFDIYGDHGNGDRSKVFPEGMITRAANTNHTNNVVAVKANIGAEERHHLYISEAELQMHQSRIPLWAKPEIYFHHLMMDDLKTEAANAQGEFEIESIPTRAVAARSKDLVPVYNNLQHQKSQPRDSSFDSSRTGPLFEKSEMSEDGRLSYRCDYSSPECTPEGGDSGKAEFHGGIGENGLSGLHLSTQPSEGFVNSDNSPKMKTTQLDLVNTEATADMQTHLNPVNINKRNLKMVYDLGDVHHELD